MVRKVIRRKEELGIKMNKDIKKEKKRIRQREKKRKKIVRKKETANSIWEYKNRGKEK